MRFQTHGIFTAFQTGKIKKVVYQRGEQIGILLNAETELALLLFSKLHFGQRQHLGESDNGIERCPDFVTHVLYKEHLHLIRLFGTVAGHCQFLVLLLQGSHRLATFVQIEYKKTSKQQ